MDKLYSKKQQEEIKCLMYKELDLETNYIYLFLF